MNIRIALLNLIATFLLLALVMEASAQPRTVGVSVGNTFTYSPTVSWSSNDSTATPPSYLVEFNDTQWEEFTVTAISGTNITMQATTDYKNGTEITTGGWVDVNTGDTENMSEEVISANLAARDSVYTSSPYNSYVINDTVIRTYLSGERDTNHINLASSGTPSYSNDLYWDKTTGVLVEVVQDVTNQTGGYTTTWSLDIQITSSNVWTVVPEFPTWTSTLLIFIAFTSATIAIAGQKQPKRTFR